MSVEVEVLVVTAAIIRNKSKCAMHEARGNECERGTVLLMRLQRRGIEFRLKGNERITWKPEWQETGLRTFGMTKEDLLSLQAQMLGVWTYSPTSTFICCDSDRASTMARDRTCWCLIVRKLL